MTQVRATAPPARWVGVFAGGRGRRMGGVAKADLLSPHANERLIERSLRVIVEARLEGLVVGSHAAMTPLPPDVPHLEDEAKGVGPLGGLLALLRYAGSRPAIALACDMPFVTPALLARLACAPNASSVLAPRDHESGKWQPLFARYDAPRVLPTLELALADGVRSFQALFARLDVSEFDLDVAERALLRDWDTPDDLVP